MPHFYSKNTVISTHFPTSSITRAVFLKDSSIIWKHSQQVLNSSLLNRRPISAKLPPAPSIYICIYVQTPHTACISLARVDTHPRRDAWFEGPAAVLLPSTVGRCALDAGSPLLLLWTLPRTQFLFSSRDTRPHLLLRTTRGVCLISSPPYFPPHAA